MAAADHGPEQREARFRRLYQANYRPVQGYAVNRLGPVTDRVLAALAQLKAGEREALLLVHWERLSYAEAAQALGCSANAVGIGVHKAKARLRALLGEETRASQHTRSEEHTSELPSH